jgi:hypothetical protein
MKDLPMSGVLGLAAIIRNHGQSPGLNKLMIAIWVILSRPV